jgi:hypothetical protein
MADQPQPPGNAPKQPAPPSPKLPRPKQMSIWDSFMLILRPDKRS